MQQEETGTPPHREGVKPEASKMSVRKTKTHEGTFEIKVGEKDMPTEQCVT